MNAYNLGITGGWWLLTLCIMAGVMFAVFTYRRTVPPIAPKRKVLLIILRTIAISLFLFVLFEPILSVIKSSLEQPKLAVLLDNSISCGIADAKGDRRKSFLESLSNSNFLSLPEKERIISIFDADVFAQQNIDTSKLNHKGQMTDISKAFKYVMANSEKENTQAVLLVTDGAFNTGTNPLYDIETLGKPVFIIGIGDSTEPRDVALQSIITNDIIYLENPVPVNVNFSITGYNEGNLTLKLFDNGNLIGEQNFSVHPERQNLTAIFEFAPKQEGIHKLTASVSSLQNEITLKNNSYSEFVTVLKNKRKVVIFAGYPNPDVSFVRNAISSEKGVEVKVFVQKKGSEFYDKMPSESDIKDAEVIALIGFPINSTPDAMLQIIKKELEKGKPLMFVAEQYTDYKKLKLIDDFMPFSVLSSQAREFLASPDVRKEALSNPVLRINGSESDLDSWNKLPPLFKTETFVRVKPESEVAFGSKVNNTPIKEPLVITRTLANKKSIAVLGYGFYRWKLFGYALDMAKGANDSPDLFDIFMQNTIKWLSANQDNKQVTIKTTKKVYTNNEKVEFIGQVYDAAFTPVDNANVQVKISGNQSREITLNSLGNGRYSSQVEGMPQGDYFFTGEVVKDSNKIGSDKGRFNIGEIALEYQNLRMNSQLLRTIAERSGGKFYMPDDAKSFIEDLKKVKTYIPRSITNHLEFQLWSLPWLLAIAILCLGLEWFLRKRAGMV